MALQVIGSGFGRTGTMSTKQALEQIGLGRCHHMLEVLENSDQLLKWKAVAAGEPIDWHDVFAGYQSQVDWPGAAVWQHTIRAFPEAKVVHTERPEEDWWNSFSVTISKFFNVAPELDMPPHFKDVFETMSEWFLKSTFEDHTDRASAIVAYRRNNQMVREMVAPDRLLIFNVAEGWEPLCKFLGCPIPETPFPRTHPRDEFWAHFGGEPE